MAAGLLVVSLALLTVFLREADGGPLHGAQRAGAAILSPLVEVGERISRPFRDAYGYVDGLVGAKAENERLRAELAELRRRQIAETGAVAENAELRRILAYRDSAAPSGYEPVVARVVQVPASPFRQEVVVSAGSGDGVQLDDPVVTPDGLAGKVVEVAGGTAKVALLTDQAVRVSALAGAGARGIVVAGASDGAGLALDRVDKGQPLEVGDLVVTAGWRTGELTSLYPRGIPIGTVTSASQSDIDLFWRVAVTPFVDFDTLADVIVLVRRES